MRACAHARRGSSVPRPIARPRARCCSSRAIPTPACAARPQTSSSRGTTRAHLARAALEAIAFQSAEVLQAMQSDSRQPLIELRVDGGATSNDLLMQFQADLLGVPVVRPEVTETTALGAAYLAGLGVGFWPSPDAVARNWRAARRFEPGMSRDEANARLRLWSRAVERSRGWHVED